MMPSSLRSGLLAVIALLPVAVVPAAGAQAWSYPSFQPPRITVREFNFGVADAGRDGTTLVFQWREQAGPRSMLNFDAGLADPDARNADLVLFGGVHGGWLLGSESEEVPLDFLLTAGAYLGIGDHTRFRVPVGVSVGKRFDFEGNVALTPYIHPRLSWDVCSGCGGGDVGVSFDLGANLELTRTISIRASGLFTGTDTFGDGFGVSIAWSPPTLAALRRQAGLSAR